MGTSSARRGPTTGLWRAAKGAATRYLAPAGQGAVTAREVVVRYLAAVAETPGQGDRLAVFRFTRKKAQALGAFWAEVRWRGLEKVVQDHHLQPLALGDLALLAPGVSGVLAGSGGGLEAAVVRTALTQVLRRALPVQDQQTPGKLVEEFLASAVALRLVLDLGEPLEAAAGSYGRLHEGLSRLQDLLDAGVADAAGQSPPPATPEHWVGLPGWTWVTVVMTALLGQFES